MKDKIVQLMKSEGLSSSRLAEILEIQPSGVSHLVSGRNKPGFDLLQKILRRFPNINPYWLMLDDEEMYRPKEELSTSQVEITLEAETHSPITPSPSVDLFAAIDNSPTPPPSQGQNVATTTPPSESSIIDLNNPKLKRVILLYEDGSCESYSVK